MFFFSALLRGRMVIRKSLKVHLVLLLVVVPWLLYGKECFLQLWWWVLWTFSLYSKSRIANKHITFIHCIWKCLLLFSLNLVLPHKSVVKWKCWIRIQNKGTVRWKNIDWRKILICISKFTVCMPDTGKQNITIWRNFSTHSYYS